MKYSLSHLEHALALAEHRGFRLAAEAVGMSQPALSRSIRYLETALGVRLFDRDRRGVEPTAFGQVVLEHARTLVAERDELDREVDLLRGLGMGRLRVDLGAYPAALSGHMAVARMISAHPRVRVSVRVTDWETVVRNVLERRTDLGLAEVSMVQHVSELRVEPLVTRRGYFACRAGHPLAARTEIALQDVLRFPWISIPLPARIRLDRAAVDVAAGRWNADRNVFVPAVSLDAVFDIGRLAVSSDAIALATLAMIERELESGALTVVPFSPDWLHANYGFIARRGRTPSPAAAAFAAEVQRVEREIDAREAELAARFAPWAAARRA